MHDQRCCFPRSRLLLSGVLASLPCCLLCLLTPSTLSAVNDLSAVFSIGHAADPPPASPRAEPAWTGTLSLNRPVWRGRKHLPLGPMRELCTSVSRSLGFPVPQTAQFLLEIAAAESDFGYYVRQVRGPAQSVWQIEPATARDMHERLPKRNPSLYRAICGLRDPSLSEEENVVTNLSYGAGLCLGVLVLKGIRFETLTSLAVRARAWKTKYNTYLGKGTLEGYCQKAMRYAGASLGDTWSPDEPIDARLVAGPDLFAARDDARFRTLPDNFDTSPMGRYYIELLGKHPEAFAEIPDALLASQTIHDMATTLLWELIRKVQHDPASVGRYADLPRALFLPIARAAMAENAMLAYPQLPDDLRADPTFRKIYEAQRFMLDHLPGR